MKTTFSHTFTQHLTPEQAAFIEEAVSGPFWAEIHADGRLTGYVEFDRQGRIIRARNRDGVEKVIDPPFDLFRRREP
jgi:hypothetical protein